ncbi:YfhO family protein [Longitalea arenae]|uniref:YfhO family protein n=1 Tax=Longitalea arenae TaxID=2812558 RepID=UPI0019674D5C|nr:YfhO family protein [Longitalea arenae]
MNEPTTSQATYTRSRDLFALLILLLVCLVSYWPLTFHVFSLKNDALIYFLPVRYQVSQSISNGYFPLWSPYLNFGHPLHADMQSGVWNPVVQLFSLFGPYTLYTLQIETLLYIYLGGVGMYYLLRYLSIPPLANLLCTTGYMLCGFNNDSCQYLLWISGSAFLPLVFLFYFRLLRSPSLYVSCLFSFFLWLLFSTANPGEFIITVYMLAAMLLVKIIVAPKENRIHLLKRLAGLHGIAILLFICLALPAIFSFAQFLPLSERGTGASYEDAMTNPLHPLLTVAYVAPLAIFDQTTFTLTDGLQRNSWFGLFPFIFFLSALVIKFKNKHKVLFKYAFLVSFIFSLGEWGLFRQIAYYTLPLMNTFRHPAMFRLYSTFFGVILAAFYLQELVQQKVTAKKHQRVFRLLLFIMAGLGILGLLNSANIYQAFHILMEGPVNRNTIANLLKIFKSSLSIYNLLLLSLIIQLPFLVLFYRFAIRNFDLKKIAYTAMVNCMVHAFIFTFFTVVKKDSARKIQALIDQHTHKGYPFPSLTSTLQENSADGMKYFKEIGSLNMYNKKIGRVHHFITPSNLLVQNDFWYNSPLQSTVMQYPLMYHADTACIQNDSAAMHLQTKKKIAFVTDSAYIHQINQLAKNSITFSLSGFTPNSFHFTCNATANSFLVLCQNRYPFWRATIDGKTTPIITVNSSFMGIAVPAGKHTLHFDFKANHILIAYIISLTTMLLFLITLVLQIKRGSLSGLK